MTPHPISRIPQPESRIAHPASAASLPDDVVLSVRGVSKKFCRNLKRSMIYGIRDLTRNLLGIAPPEFRVNPELRTQNREPALRKDEFWALKDVSLDLKRGESLGVIGVNGSGKSTLFRVIHGIFPPDEGEIFVRGSQGALIALGAGFHPHMTGRENIFLNGAILGIPRGDIEERLGEIIDFAGIGEFIDAPVSTYSSGMHVRLGFSVAVHMNPDILLIDEVFAVGDTSFQNKCIRHLRKLLSKERTILFVSHSMSNIQRICSRVMLLDHGRLIADGKPTEVIGEYLQRAAQAELREVVSDKGVGQVAVRTHESDLATILSVSMPRDVQAAANQVLYREGAAFAVCFDVHKRIPSLTIELLFFATSAGCIAARTRQLTRSASLGEGRYTAQIRCGEVALLPGVYQIHAAIFDENTVLSMVENACPLVVVARGKGPMHNIGGFVEIEGEMSLSDGREK